MAWDHGPVAQLLMPVGDAASPWEQADLLSLVAQPAVVAPTAPEAEPEPEPEPQLEREIAVNPEPQSGSPQRLLILDTETTGLDPREHQCIERRR